MFRLGLAPLHLAQNVPRAFPVVGWTCATTPKRPCQLAMAPLRKARTRAKQPAPHLATHPCRVARAPATPRPPSITLTIRNRAALFVTPPTASPRLPCLRVCTAGRQQGLVPRHVRKRGQGVVRGRVLTERPVQVLPVDRRRRGRGLQAPPRKRRPLQGRPPPHPAAPCPPAQSPATLASGAGLVPVRAHAHVCEQHVRCSRSAASPFCFLLFFPLLPFPLLLSHAAHSCAARRRRPVASLSRWKP